MKTLKERHIDFLEHWQFVGGGNVVDYTCPACGANVLITAPSMFDRRQEWDGYSTCYECGTLNHVIRDQYRAKVVMAA